MAAARNRVAHPAHPAHFGHGQIGMAGVPLHQLGRDAQTHAYPLSAADAAASWWKPNRW